MFLVYLKIFFLEKLERFCNALYGHRLSLTPALAKCVGRELSMIFNIKRLHCGSDLKMASILKLFTAVNV